MGSRQPAGLVETTSARSIVPVRRGRREARLSIVANLSYSLLANLLQAAAERGIDQDDALERALLEGWFAPEILTVQVEADPPDQEGVA